MKKCISKKGAKRQFTTVGLALIVYILFVLIIPVAARIYLNNIDFVIEVDDNLLITVFYVMLIIGTIISFGAIRRSFKVKLKEILRKAPISMGQLIKELFVLFTIASLAIFITEGIANQLGITISLIFNIGSIAADTYFENNLYFFIFIIASPIVEEIAFRGCMLKSLSRFGKVFSILVTSFIYALAHGSFIEMIPAFVISYMLSCVSIRYHSVQPCIFIRILFNAAIYGLSLIPEAYSIYMVGTLIFVYVVTIIMLFTKKYKFVTFKTSEKPWSIVSVFFSTPTIIIAILLFIADSVFIELFF